MAEKTYPRVVFEDDFGERQQAEMSDRGYCSGAVVESEDGSRYPVFFIEPGRMQQELEASKKHQNEPWFAEPALIVVDVVTLDLMQKAVSALWKAEFFQHLKPL